MDAIAKYSAVQGTQQKLAVQKDSTCSPKAGDSEVLLSAFYDKVVSFSGRNSSLRGVASPVFAWIIFRLFFFFIRLFVKHCIAVLLLWALALHESLPVYPQSITECDVFICCNLFSSSLLHTFLYWILWMVCALLLCCKWFSGAACFSLAAEASDVDRCFIRGEATTWALILWIMPLALINIVLPQHLSGIVRLSPTHSQEAAL